VRGVNAEFTVTEEMLGIQPTKETVTGEDIFQEIQDLMSNIISVLINFTSFYRRITCDGWKQECLIYKNKR
jgi:hypothetical protein